VLHTAFLGVFAAIHVAALLWPAQALAQIYAWRDANGTLVLSDQKIDGPIDIFEVAGAPSIRTTRPVQTNAGASVYEALVLEHASKQSLRPELVFAVIQVESGFNPRALSPKGAMGLMQLMPATARDLGVRNPYDPDDNIRGGTMYLRQLLDKYSGNEELALAAYNAGPAAVDRYGRQVPPYRETRNYVKQVDAVAARTPEARRPVIYKTIEIVDGRAVPRYSSERPPVGSYEILGR
jgi:soluble lytic murein transglycosylase-like protein